MIFGIRNRGNESENNSGNINNNLELEKFRDRVVDTAILYNCFNDAGKIIIYNNNLRYFLSDFNISDIYGKSNIGSFESRAVIYIIARYSHSFIKAFETFYKDTLIF
jgi:hypothetical protein